MEQQVYVGLCVTSHQTGVLCTAVFDNVDDGQPTTSELRDDMLGVNSSMWARIEFHVEEGLVDIIDLATGRLTARAEFPFLPEVIRDGFAYRLFTPEDDFPAVRVYRIDPRLYALREELN